MKAFGFAGWSGSGKTTLIEQLIPLLIARGLRVSLVKHTHHGFDLDRPGKDSHRFRTAGAAEVMLAGAHRWALMRELDESQPPSLDELIARLAPCDLVVVEGFKTADLPKIEVYRPAVGKPFFHADCPNVLAIASDVALDVGLPVLDLNNPPEIADFVLNYTGLACSAQRMC
ncbi:molybdopterin-guanine dinucleotide biosynthesis protein B [Uliginosibacterium gangwonense]|uniref:molybdopterin-guanine dinucleotide biosynthesis protein B n=1 Tax=Uliginosibacterium gangwonense TaxID=392736 RepID=UPI00036345C8|nr:molybdopterin-guanine dinucleotide biosynthesis protein B [Uliginosibacterium gangwonense]